MSIRDVCTGAKKYHVTMLSGEPYVVFDWDLDTVYLNRKELLELLRSLPKKKRPEKVSEVLPRFFSELEEAKRRLEKKGE